MAIICGIIVRIGDADPHFCMPARSTGTIQEKERNEEERRYVCL